jgi:iron(III) transport system substrate-binding protein
MTVPPTAKAGLRCSCYKVAMTTCHRFAILAAAVAFSATALAADIAAAKREGELNLYTSMNANLVPQVKADFEKRYGVKVNVWRASSENVVQRVTSEAQAGRFEADVVETNGPEMESVQREGLLRRIDSPLFAHLLPQAVFPHHEWVATRLIVFVQCYNTREVKRAQVPRSFGDLLDPRWKGRLAMEADDADWFQTVVTDMGEEKGLAFFRKLVATNGVSVRKGHAVLGELVNSGEIPFALDCYSYKAWGDKKKGAPVEWTSFGPLLARPNGGGVTRKAPHPNAALLFYEYMISDAQPLLAKLDLEPVDTRVKTQLQGREVQFIDPRKVLQESAKWQKLYDEIIVKGARPR